MSVELQLEKAFNMRYTAAVRIGFAMQNIFMSKSFKHERFLEE